MGANSSKKAVGQENVNSWGSTEVEKEEFSYLWTIKDYSMLSSKNEIMSPIFQGGPTSQHKWQLKVVPKSKIDHLEWFGLYLYLVDFGDGNVPKDRELKTLIQLSILDAQDKPRNQRQSGIAGNDYKKGGGLGWNKFILISKLVSSAIPLIVDNKLKIYCRVIIEGVVKENTGTGGPIKETLIVNVKEELQKDFGELLQSTDFADISINTRTRNFMAHKAIVASRSKVFAAMFSNKMLESSTRTVEIQDFDADIVEEMINYMYTGQVNSLTDKAPKLLQIAEKYDIPGLKKNCENSLAENLRVENAANVLMVAHYNNADALKVKVISFINRNKEAVRKTTGFHIVAISNPEVLMELYLSQ